MGNEVLDAIMQRRSIYQFKPEAVPTEKITSILEAGRWAPSYANSQPWEFITVTDSKLKQEVVEIAKETMAAHAGIEGAHTIIATCVDPEKDQYHFIEDGAVATQNMALAAHSLGLATYWVGIFSLMNDRKSVEHRIKEVLNIPEKIRVISLLPIGVPAYSVEKQRKRLEEICHVDKYGSRQSGVGVEDQDKKTEIEAQRHGMRAHLPRVAPT
ncbi:MAG: nitroreductase family protein [Candidatus Bathyarchaeia archaeon]|jgi:nitroreductase